MDFITAASIKRILYLLVIVAAALFITYNEYITQPIWLLFASLFLAHVTLEERLLKRTFIIIVCGVLAAIAVLLGGLVADNIILSILFLMLVTAACTWQGLLDDAWAYPVLIINVMAVLAIYKSASFGMSAQRAMAVIDGVIIVADAQLILLPFFAGNEYNRTRKITFYHLRNYTRAIFECLTSADYPDAVYYYERCLHKDKVKCMHGITMLAKQEKQRGFAEPGFNAAQIQRIFSLLVDISQIRRRNTDHTAFALCAPELINLEHVIVMLLNACANQDIRQLPPLLDMLQNRVMQLDDNLENVVKVAAREPVVFVLFRTALQGFYDDMVEAAS